MQMFRQAGSGTASEIHSYIKSMRLNGQRQGFLRLPHQFEHLQHLRIVGFIQRGDVPQGGNQKMAVVVRKTVQYDQTARRSPQDQIFAVLVRSADIIAQKTGAFLGQSLNIRHSPGRP